MRRAEPHAKLDAAAGMSAQFRPEAVSPRRAIPRSVSSPSLAASLAERGEAAFEAWLRRELGRLYSTALAEPVPEELLRLLGTPTAKAGRGTPGATAA